MQNTLVVILVVSMLSFLSNVQGEEDTTSMKILQKMYSVLRMMALPDAPTEENKPVSQRFVLQVPGKILNPLDYDPNNYTQDVTTNRLSSFIPPVIEENMFRLTDIVPVAHPMKGGETGESFTDMYEAVLNQLDVRSFKKKTEAGQKRYKDAIDYLAQQLPDPEDLSKNTTRLGMYVKLQKKYNDVRLDMEGKIKETKEKYEDDPVKYQTWFQTHYPAMYANVENAYTEWLVFGEKDLVELYKAHLDVESQGVAVEEARMALRSSGKVSLDRSSTIYPVHFEPSNWYEYLRAKPQSLSKEQIQIKLGSIEAKLAVIESMEGKEKNLAVQEYINGLKETRDKTEEELSIKTSKLYDHKLECIKNQNCENFREDQNKIAELSNTFAEQKAKVEFAEFQLGSTNKSIESLNRLRTGLQAQKNNLQTLLDMAQAGEITDISKPSSENDTQDIQAGWMDFDFDSSTSKTSEESSSESYATSMKFSGGGFLWSVSGGASYSKAKSKFAKEMSEANVKIAAKILKVTIKRPWFKSTVFQFNDIMMRDTDKKVSPGPAPDKELIDKLQGGSKTGYLLPQFVNAFLLAKDVKMEFQGVDSFVKSHALQESASAHLSGSYGPFSASASFNYGSSESSLKVQSTADGLRISIPGAQVIGYYVTVLPCFPHDLKECQ